MGWQDREYHWDGEQDYGGGTWRPPVVTAWLLGILIAVFVLVQSVSGPEYLAWWSYLLSPFGWSIQPWRGGLAVVTIIFVLLTLGARIERSDGGGTLVGLFLLGSLAGVAAHLAVALTAPSLAGLPVAPIPNGGFAAMAMFGMHRYRDEHVSLFGYVRTVSWVIGLVALVMLAFRFLSLGPDAIGWLTGTLAGALVGTTPESVRDLSQWWAVLRPRRRPRAAVRPSIPRTPPPVEEPDPLTTTLDDLLEKISREGIEALTDEERDQLERARSRLQKRT